MDPRTVLASAAVASLLAACAASAPADVTVSLDEWSVTPSVARVAPGDVVFTVRNDGSLEHELVVVRSDVAAGDLPVRNGEVDEGTVDTLGEVPETAAGGTGSVRLALPQGHYILFCNVPGHYEKGMYAELTVD